jgi:hypothetical protein
MGTDRAGSEPVNISNEQDTVEAEARRWLDAAVNAGVEIVAEVDKAGWPYIRLNGQVWRDGEAEAVALAMLAAVADARQQANQSSGVAGGGARHE